MKWWSRNRADRIKSLLGEPYVRDVVFAPIIKAIKLTDATTSGEVRTTIASVALANAIMAGLPGKLGVGVFISIALEGWMAVRIARLVGININKPTDIFKYLGPIAAFFLVVFWGFKHLFGFVFSLINLIPFVPATIVTELILVNFIGVMFWVGFEEANSSGSFTIPMRLLGRVRRQAFDLIRHQYKAIKGTLSPANIRQVGERIRAWLTGDMVLPKHAPAEVFVAGAFAALLQHDFTYIKGPLGDVFIQSIQDRWSRELSTASIEEIAEYMTRYDADQLVGVMNVIKGKMFEHLVAIHENADGDEWGASLHADESYPGSDIVFTNFETGASIEVSLKAVTDQSIIEHALLRYPDIPILTTSEMEGPFSDVDMVSTANISHEGLAKNTDQLFDEMMTMTSASSERLQTMLGVGAGTASGGVVQLWPFVAAYMRGRISKDNLNMAFKKVLGDEGIKLANRIALAAVFGPIYAWYLLGRGVVGMTLSNNSDDQVDGKQVTTNRRLVYKPRMAFTI